MHFDAPTTKATHIHNLPATHPNHPLKAQPPSTVGIALGNAAHNKTRPNGAKSFY
jgi:hypothetical protein